MNSTVRMENSYDNGCYPEEFPSERESYFAFFLVIIIAAIPSNFFSLYVSWQHIRQRNELGVYLFNLALSDLTYTIGLALWVEFTWRGHWVHGSFVCVLSVYLLFTNFYTSDALLCCIAVDRYLALVHPLKFPALRRVGTATVVSVSIWALVVSLNIASISLKDSYDDTERVVCFDVFPLSKRTAQVNVARFFLGFLFPVLLVAFCSRGICVALRSNQAMKEQERSKVSRLLGVVLLTLVCCLGPVHVMMLLRALLEDCGGPVWLISLYKISLAISSLNCLADPLLYCFITRTGKSNATQVVLFLQRKRKVNDQEVV